MSQPGGSIHFSGNDTMNATRIFNGRLTYDKGGAIVHTLRFVTNNDSLWFQTLRGFQMTYTNSTASTVDFMNYYQAQTGINPTQFFNQWYYGQGYPTFDVSWNFTGNTAIIKSVQSTSMPSSVPVFITPVEYRLTRSSAPDTIIRVMHTSNTEFYTIPLTGSVTGVVVDPNNWLINKTLGPQKDANLTASGLAEGIENSISIKVGPNPTAGVFEVELTRLQTALLTITDAKGMLVKTVTLNGKTQVDLTDKSAGVYLLNISDASGKNVYSSKLMKK